jgi:hypothetical protein
MFLIRDKGTKNSAHYWDGNDTACRMWSTGGMNKDRKWSVHADPGSHPICSMCASAWPGLARAHHSTEVMEAKAEMESSISTALVIAARQFHKRTGLQPIGINVKEVEVWQLGGQKLNLHSVEILLPPAQ